MRAIAFAANTSGSSVGTQLQRVLLLSTLLVTSLGSLVVFSAAMEPTSFEANNSFMLRDSSINVAPANIACSTDCMTVTLQPKSNLTAGGATCYMHIGYVSYVYDLGGNRFPGTSIYFITDEGGTGTHASGNWMRISTYQEFRGRRL
ncbi:MAG: Ig-like domain-containing protein [Terriglobales bacterium]|jgi:hypothetical protein